MIRTPDAVTGCVIMRTFLDSNFRAMELEAQPEPLLLVSMSIRDYLDRTEFDGETIRQMGTAFEMALASLGTTPGCDNPIRTALAQIIIVLAQAAERDPERKGASIVLVLCSVT
jgi:hypothetical protein